MKLMRRARTIKVQLSRFMESKSNILVVDDNPDKLGLIEAALSLAGYHVTTATDGDEALAAIESYQPDLVITDVMMPRMNGYELAQRIRANPSRSLFPSSCRLPPAAALKTCAGHRKSALWATSPIRPISICCWRGPEHCSSSRRTSTFVKKLLLRTI